MLQLHQADNANCAFIADAHKFESCTPLHGRGRDYRNTCPGDTMETMFENWPLSKTTFGLTRELRQADSAFSRKQWPSLTKDDASPARANSLSRARREFDSSDSVSYYPQDREAGYILLCTAKGGRICASAYKFKPKCARTARRFPCPRPTLK